MRLRCLLRDSFSLLVFVGGVASLGCSSDATEAEQPQTRSVEYELFPSTHELSTSDLAALTEVGAKGELRFDPAPESLHGLKIGEVLLAGITNKTPHGLLRVVLDAEREDDGALTLRTGAAPLQMAFRKLHARIADETTPFTAAAAYTGTDVSPLAQGPGLTPQFSIGGDLGDSQSYELVVFDGDGNRDTRNDQLLLDAELGGGFRYDLSIDVDWGSVERLPEIVAECLTSVIDLAEGELPSCEPEDLLPELQLGLSVEPHLRAAIAARGAASVGFEETFDIGTITLAPFAVGPLVIAPNADIVATMAGSASARFSASAHANLSARSSVRLSSKVKNSEIVPFELGETDVDAESPEVDLYAEISAKPGVRFVLALYGIIGPYATVAASATLRANPLEDPCWDFSLGLETELGVIVKTPSIPGFGALTFLDWNTGPLPLWDESVASGSCDVTAEGARTPPGGGPTAEILQKPSFTPWARLTGLEAEGGDLESVLAYATGFPFITPSIDGRYVAGGGRALGVLKLDEEGATTWKTAIATSNSPLESLGSAPSGDAGLITLYRGESSTFVVVKQGQSGAASRVVGVDLPTACGATVQALATNGRGGVFVTGECPFSKSAWLVELDSELALVAASELRDSDPSAIRLIPTLLTLHDDELIWGGQLSRTGEASGSLGFLTRLSTAGEATRSTAFACPERLSFYPTAAIASAAGSLTLVGDAAGVGFVARLKADGSLGFARFPNLGGGVQSGFSPSAVIELPSTGMVLASTVDGLGDNPTDIILLGLDGNGFTIWGREYSLRDETGKGLRALGWPSARLTDDGGILVTATAGPEGDSPGEILAMKVFARDGSLPDDSLVVSADVAPDESPIDVEQRYFEPSLASLDVSLRELPLP